MDFDLPKEAPCRGEFIGALAFPNQSRFDLQNHFCALLHWFSGFHATEDDAPKKKEKEEIEEYVLYSALFEAVMLKYDSFRIHSLDSGLKGIVIMVSPMNADSVSDG